MDHNIDTVWLEGTQVLNSLFAEYASEEYAEAYMQRRHSLRSAFRNFHSSSPEEQEYLKRLVDLHTEECRARGSAESRRRHNAFVLTYITDRKYTPKEIARMQGITTRAVWKDLNHVVDDMMILAFGVDGIKPTAKDTRPPLCASLREQNPQRSCLCGKMHPAFYGGCNRPQSKIGTPGIAVISNIRCSYVHYFAGFTFHCGT